MCMKTGFYVPEDGLPRSVAAWALRAFCPSNCERRVGARGDGDKPRPCMLELPYPSRAASYGSSSGSSYTSSELGPATTGSPGGRLCCGRTPAAWLTCRQHGVLQLISTCYNERENEGAETP